MNRWKGYFNIKMNYFPEWYIHTKKVNVELNLPNYATKCSLEKAKCVDI